MGEFSNYIQTIEPEGLVPYGGTLHPTSDEFAIAMANHIKGGFAVVPTLEVLADIPYAMLVMGMSISVREHERTDGSIHPRSIYYLRKMPPANTRISEILNYNVFEYWTVESIGNFDNNADISVQYAPNYEGKRPRFLSSEISDPAYQAGYPTEETYQGGNPTDIIWANEYSPTLNHVWVRQRIGTQPWGIPISISASGDYEQNQFIDVIFKWVNKGDPTPSRPIQPDNYKEYPVGWSNTPGGSYDVQILTQDLYRSQALKNPYGILKSAWDIPILVSSNPLLVRYGNTPGNTEYLNSAFWRGYYTPGLDTFMATRATILSNEWSISKIDQESGEFDDFVFLALPWGSSTQDIIDATPTLTIPIGGAFPNNCQDGPFAVAVNELLYVSKATKYSDGSLKTPWSIPKRFDGQDTIQALVNFTPGDTFYKSRNTSGNLVYAFPAIVLSAELYKGVTLITSGITGYKWYRGATLIVFDTNTRKATNLGVEYNNYHEVSIDGKSLTINPEGIVVTQEYAVGITHDSRLDDYEDNIQLMDATDDGAAFLAGIEAVSGTTFKNQVGLYQFNGQFFKGGLLDVANVTFTWSIKQPNGAALSGALRNSGGAAIGDTNVAASSIYVLGSDIDQYAVLEITGVFGTVTRTARVTLTDVQDGQSLETLYWGTGTTMPGNPTDFSPRTLTKAQVLALNIGYLEDASGTWFMIQRVNGVWGGEIQLRSESARPNGGINIVIYKNIDFGVDPEPGAPLVPVTGSIIPAGWTITPTAFTGSQDATYMSSCLFLLRTDVTADPSVLTRDNYNPSGSYGTPKRITGIDGANSSPGINGDKGWSPLIAVVADGERRVLWLVDWVGGTGTKPSGAGGSASYVGPTGLTTIGAATDFRGAAGTNALSRPQNVGTSGSYQSRWFNPSIAIHTNNGEVHMHTVTVTNNYNEPRWFLIMGDCTAREDELSDILALKLYERTGADRLTATRIQVDACRQRVDIGSWNINGGTTNQFGLKFSVDYLALIQPNETRYYDLAMQQYEGGGSYRSGGYLKFMGL